MVPPDVPPRRLAIAVACVAAAMLILEIEVTRLFSVLFFYHFSFFAISLVMSGLVIGGILASRWNAAEMPMAAYTERLAGLAALFSGGIAAATLGLIAYARPDRVASPSLPSVASYALVFLPGLIAAGAFLALAFARNKAWIGRLYAWDLVAAALACLLAIVVLRTFRGPAFFLVPVLIAAVGAAVLGTRPLTRGAGLALIELTLVLGIANHAIDHDLLRLRTKDDAKPMFERWNEHSRIQVWDHGIARSIVIDRSAATLTWNLPARPDGKPVDPQPHWANGPQYQVYAVGRPIRDVAIIGVGGGPDLLPPLWHRARSIDGYELNKIIIDLLQRDFKTFTSLAQRPEVRLLHTDARAGITHSGKQYDVIQASMIDTWAATASGGFVLSENSLYTREAWKTFLEHLSPTGILTMTRWHLPNAPAESYRLVGLAASGLEDAGFADAASRLILVRSDKSETAAAFTASEQISFATILVSRAPFTPVEVQRLRQTVEAQGGQMMIAPGVPPRDPVFTQLLSKSTRGPAIQANRFDIRPPTDTKPYFFLQVRPMDLFRLSEKTFGSITEVTFNGVRVLMVLAGCALALVVLVALLTVFSLPGSSTTPAMRRKYRTMTVYFVGIGLGYIFIQLALHQRLIILLGHPTFAFSVVLFCMLLGTGAGSLYSEKLFPTGSFTRPAAAILGTLALLLLVFPFLGVLERIGWAPLRTGIIVLIVTGVGFVLGFPFPLGVRQVAPTGEWAVQRMWANNGAASIAASVLAAALGLAVGSVGVLGVGLGAYAMAMLAGTLSSRIA